MRLITVNPNSWPSLAATLLHKAGDYRSCFIGVQETKIHADDIQYNVAAAAADGWQLFLNPCLKAARASAGVGFLTPIGAAVSVLKAEHVGIPIPQNARMGFWCVQAAFDSGFIAAVLYLKDIMGMTGLNLDVLNQAATYYAPSGSPLSFSPIGTMCLTT